jgi:hypothetical protein
MAAMVEWSVTDILTTTIAIHEGMPAMVAPLASMVCL